MILGYIIKGILFHRLISGAVDLIGCFFFSFILTDEERGSMIDLSFKQMFICLNEGGFI